MGSDKAKAIKDAKALNAHIYASASLTVNILAAHPETPKLSAVILRHIELCEIKRQRGKLADNTLKTKRSIGEAIRKQFEGREIGDVSVRDLASFIAGYAEAGKERMAQAVRSEAIEIWKTAIAEGWITDNVPERTRTVDVEVKRERLTLDAYRAIRAAADSLEPWIGLSMDLAMVTAQRREDIALMEFRERDISTAWVGDGHLWVIQQKTGNCVCIPLDLRLDVLGLSVGEVVNRCRDRVVSKFLLHHRRNYVGVQAGGQVWKDTVSRGFQRARDLSGLEWETPPTFHEMRSLSIRLYADQGVNVQALAGHKDAATTALYRDLRGAEWIKVSA